MFCPLSSSTTFHFLWGLRRRTSHRSPIPRHLPNPEFPTQHSFALPLDLDKWRFFLPKRMGLDPSLVILCHQDPSQSLTPSEIDWGDFLCLLLPPCGWALLLLSDSSLGPR